MFTVEGPAATAAVMGRPCQGILSHPAAAVRWRAAASLTHVLLILLCVVAPAAAALQPKSKPPDNSPSSIWKGRRCTFVRAEVDSRNPQRMGWSLEPVVSGAGKLLNGSVTSYEEELAGKKVCHMVTLPDNVVQYKFTLLESHRKKWHNGQVGLASDPHCSRFQYTMSNPLAVTKDVGGLSVDKLLPVECVQRGQDGKCKKSAPGFASWPCEEVAPVYFKQWDDGRLPLPRLNNATKRPGAPALSPAAPGTPAASPRPQRFLVRQQCPSKPSYRLPGANGPTDNGCGPDMIPIVETLATDGEFFVMQECWQSAQPVPFNVMDPFNPRYQGYCQAVEASLLDGCYTVLRFSTGVANRGNCDLYLGNPIAEAANGSTTYQWAECHKHWHWQNFATYEILDPVTQDVSRAAKAGFCALDSHDLPNRYTVAKGGEKQRLDNKGKVRFDSCGEFNMTGCQGVSVGRQDVYDYTLSGQFFCMDGCRTGQAPLQWGKQYTIRITTNPAYEPSSERDPCFRDEDGECRRFFELNYTNNVLEYTFTLTKDLLKGMGNTPGPFFPGTRNPRQPILQSDLDWFQRVNKSLIEARDNEASGLGVQFLSGRPVDPLQTLPSMQANTTVASTITNTTVGSPIPPSSPNEARTVGGVTQGAVGVTPPTATVPTAGGSTQAPASGRRLLVDGEAQVKVPDAQAGREREGSGRTLHATGKLKKGKKKLTKQTKLDPTLIPRKTRYTDNNMVCRKLCGDADCARATYFEYQPDNHFCQCQTCRQLPVNGVGPETEEVCWGLYCEQFIVA